MHIPRMVFICALCFMVAINSVLAASLEETISQRRSVRSYDPADITSEQLMSVLRASYGYAGTNRVLPRIGSGYSLAIYVVNSTSCYVYNPEANSLSLHDSSVNKETIRPHLHSWLNDASAILVIVWDQTRTNNLYIASLEAGCLAQNIYLAAITQNLGTCCVGGFDASIRYDLNLPTSLLPILEMPLGYPANSTYSFETPAFDRMTGNLPLVQVNNLSFMDTLGRINYAQAWSSENLSVQEISQLLWAAYGYSSTGHRTTPSAMNVYPMEVYVSNSTGVYEYEAENHSVMLVHLGDKRNEIATACGNQLWAAFAPAVFIVAYNSSSDGGATDSAASDHQYVGVDAGCIAQQILLEASAEDLSVNFIADALETWNGIGARSLRNILNLAPDVYVLYIMPVGHAELPPPIPEIPDQSTDQSYSIITIKPDGSIEGTDKIQRQGNTYTLTGDIIGGIEVQKSNIVIDGAGHTLQGRKIVDERGMYLVGPDGSDTNCRHILVKNLRIRNFFEGIYIVGGSNNSIIGNYLENAVIHLIGGANLTGDLIKYNTFSDAGIFVDHNSGGIDVITENNFINSTIFVDLAAPPIVDKNYWSNYTANYPDAKEIGSTGIWDTPYVYDKFVDGSHGDDPCIDYHPLMRPVGIPAFPDTEPPAVSVVSPENKTYTSNNVSLTVTVNEPVVWMGYSLDGKENVTISGNATLAELQNGVHSLVVFANDTFGNMGASEITSFTAAVPETFPTVPIIASVVTVAVAVAGLLVYFKRRKHIAESTST